MLKVEQNPKANPNAVYLLMRTKLCEKLAGNGRECDDKSLVSEFFKKGGKPNDLRMMQEQCIEKSFKKINLEKEAEAIATAWVEYQENHASGKVGMMFYYQSYSGLRARGSSYFDKYREEIKARIKGEVLKCASVFEAYPQMQEAMLTLLKERRIINSFYEPQDWNNWNNLTAIINLNRLLDANLSHIPDYLKAMDEKITANRCDRNALANELGLMIGLIRKCPGDYELIPLVITSFRGEIAHLYYFIGLLGNIKKLIYTGIIMTEYEPKHKPEDFIADSIIGQIVGYEYVHRYYELESWESEKIENHLNKVMKLNKIPKEEVMAKVKKILE